MTIRMAFVVLALLMCCGVCHAKEERWSNFAEDNDLKYYLDQKSVVSLPDNVYILWVKSIAKDKNFFKREYNLNNLSYIFTNYEIDCAVSSYRIRGTIMFDKNRREINKSLPEGGEPVFEPVPPESMLELVQDEICVKEEGAVKASESEPQESAGPAVRTAPATSASPAALLAAVPVASAEPVEPAAPAEKVEPTAVERVEPAAPVDQLEPAAPVEPPSIE